jgi:hypothetical protein
METDMPFLSFRKTRRPVIVAKRAAKAGHQVFCET